MQLLADKLNHFLHGRDLARVDEKFIMSFQKDVERDLSPYIHIFAAMQEAVKTQKQVYSDGASQLIEQPEFQNVEKNAGYIEFIGKAGYTGKHASLHYGSSDCGPYRYRKCI